MKKIYLSERDLLSFQTFITKKTNEGIIFEYDEENLLKYFNYLCDNKYLTIELIDKHYNQLSNLPFLLFHNKEVFIDNNLKGIIIPKGFKLTLSNYLELSTTTFNDKIIVMKNIGKALETLKKLRNSKDICDSFFIGDIHEKNILVDPETKDIQFIDLDSCKLEDNKAVLCKYLQFFQTYSYVVKYLKHKYPKQSNCYFTNNEDTDLYCYHSLIMMTLFNTKIHTMDIASFYNYVNNLQNLGIPLELCDSLQKLYFPGKNINPYCSLDNIPESFEKKLNLSKM